MKRIALISLMLGLMGVFINTLMSDALILSIAPGTYIRAPQAPPPYPHATNSSTIIEAIWPSIHVTRFDTTDQVDDVLCFYNRELRHANWSEGRLTWYNPPTETRLEGQRLGTITPLRCPQLYDYYQRIDPPEYENSTYRSLFRIEYTAEGTILHVKTSLIYEGNGLR